MGNWQSSRYGLSDSVNFYDLEARDIYGHMRRMDEWRGKVLLVTNVASKWGLTQRHYAEFVELREKLNPRGFEILAFPCAQFNNQEFPTNEEVMDFAIKAGARFPLFDRVEVNGSKASPLFQHLKLQSGQFGTAKKLGAIGWNFGKFLLDREGLVVNYFGPRTFPKDFEATIEEVLDGTLKGRKVEDGGGRA